MSAADDRPIALFAPLLPYWHSLRREGLRDRPGLRHVLIAAAIFAGFTLLFALHRYWTLYASYDQGIFNQVFWNNLHGRFFQSSLSSSLSSAVKQDGAAAEVFYHRLGQHFTPALLLWLPFYALHSQAVTLVFLQVGLITAAGFMLYALARQHLGVTLSAWIATSYYAANAVIGPTFSNFHDLCQIPLFIFTLLWAMERRLWGLFWVMAALTLMVREDQGIGLFGVGVYMVLSRRFVAQGLALCALAFLYVLACTSVFMPFFSPDISKRFMVERFGQYVGEDSEASSVEILKAMLSKPWLVLWEMINPPFDTLKYLAGQWLPLAFVPAVAPAAWAIAGFPLLKIFLQQGQSAMSINIRYAILVVPGLFYGAILWWAGSGKSLSPKFKKIWAICMALSVLFSLTSNPHRAFYFAIPDSVQPWVYVSLPEQWRHTAAARDVMAKISPEATISATTYLVPPLSSRRAIIRLPETKITGDDRQTRPVDVLLADFWQLDRYQAAFNKERGDFAATLPLVDRVLADGSYGLVALRDGVALLQRGQASQPAALAAWQALRPTLKPRTAAR